VRVRFSAARGILVAVVAGATVLGVGQVSASAGNPYALPKSPISASTLMAQAVHAGKITPQASSLSGPQSKPLTNVEASPGGQPVDEDPIATNPANSQQLLSGGNDYNCGNIQGFYSSSNGGTTWSHFCMQNLPGSSGCGDPAVGYDLTGASYIMGLDCSGAGDGIFQKSTNNGGSWSAPAEAVKYLLSGAFVDKEWLQIDTNASSPGKNNLYACATQFDGNNGTEISVSHSYDGGGTWATVAATSLASYPTINQFCDLTTGPDGSVYLSWMQCVANGPSGDCGGTNATMYEAKSSDFGKTWSAPVTIGTAALAPDSCGAFYGCWPGTSERLSDIPVISASPTNGHVYAVYYNYTGTKTQFVYSTSTDGGATWSAATPVFTKDKGNEVFQWDTVSATGVLGVTGMVSTSPTATTYNEYAYLNTAPPAQKAAFSHTKLSTKTSSTTSDGFGGGFIGDYTGNSWSGTTLHASWMDTRNGNSQDFTGGLVSKK